MFAPEEKAIGEYYGRTSAACDPDDGSGAAFLARGERWFVVEYEIVPDAVTVELSP
jgi:hypothetical protein